MRKIFTLVACVATSISFFAAQQNLWSGIHVLGATGEDALMIEASQLTALELNDSLAVTVTDMTDSYCQLNLAGCSPWTTIPGSEWSDITEEGTYYYRIATADLLSSIKTGGLMIQGKLCTITSVDRIYQSENNPDPEPEPEIEGTKVIWTGDMAISWDEAAYAGVQFETANAGISFVDLKKDYYLFFYVSSIEADAQYELCKSDWSSLTGAAIAQTDTMFVYQVTDESLVAEIVANGLIIKGIRFHLTSIVISSTAPNNPDPEPQPEQTEYVFNTVWTGDIAISWNQEVYTGTEFDTYTIQADMLAGVQEGDSIKIYYVEAIDDAQFALSYKAGTDWTWTDLSVTQHEGFFAYRVASDDIAMDIADHGLVIRGQGYHLISIAIGAPKSTTDIHSIPAPTTDVQKVLRNGQLYIMRNGIIYLVNGLCVQ